MITSKIIGGMIIAEIYNRRVVFIFWYNFCIDFSTDVIFVMYILLKKNLT